MSRIAILDFGLGNVKSIYNMFRRIGVDSFITSNAVDLINADKYILPGVGSFDHGIVSLRKATFFPILEKEVLLKNKPILGICLGMQLLTKSSSEGKELGLGWIEAHTLKFNISNQLSVPHMGWNIVYPKVEQGIFRDLTHNRFYFVHSYYVECANLGDVLATSDYGGRFCCSLRNKNIFGVQFHPEKSHKYGMQLLKNFSEL